MLNPAACLVGPARPPPPINAPTTLPNPGMLPNDVNELNAPLPPNNPVSALVMPDPPSRLSPTPIGPPVANAPISFTAVLIFFASFPLIPKAFSAIPSTAGFVNKLVGSTLVIASLRLDPAFSTKFVTLSAATLMLSVILVVKLSIAAPGSDAILAKPEDLANESIALVLIVALPFKRFVTVALTLLVTALVT